MACLPLHVLLPPLRLLQQLRLRVPLQHPLHRAHPLLHNPLHRVLRRRRHVLEQQLLRLLHHLQPPLQLHLRQPLLQPVAQWSTVRNAATPIRAAIASARRVVTT